MEKYKIFILSFFSFAFLILSTAFVHAKDTVNPSFGEDLEGRVEKILEEKEIIPEFGEEKQLYQKLEIIITKGSLKGERIIVENGLVPVINLEKYRVKDRVVVHNAGIDESGNYLFYITDYVRRGPLAFLFIFFIVLTIAVAGKRGAASILGMGISFTVILKFILPKILSGSDPVLVSIAGSMIIIPVIFYLSHGLNKKTSVAIAGTVIALIFTGLLARYFVDAVRLTGFSSEEAGFLFSAKGEIINIKGLLLAGIIIGVLGVLDDITVSQSAIVLKLKKTDPKLKFRELFFRAMDVGQDHISSMVNTLVLVYTGAALPLLLLFVESPYSFLEIINYEVIADEIVRTLVGSIGLVTAVPLTTFIAAKIFADEK